MLGYFTPSQVSCAQVVVAYEEELLERNHSLGNQSDYHSAQTNMICPSVAAHP